jgi:hypothetical protein
MKMAAMQRQDAISRLHVGAPCTLAPTLARLERSRAAKPLWSPNTNRATVNTSSCRRHEDYRASHRRMLFDVRLRRTLTHSQGYKSYAVRTVISGWFVYHPIANQLSAHSKQGRQFQFHYGTQRLRKVQHSRCDMFRPRYHEPGRGSSTEPAGERRCKFAQKSSADGRRISSTSADKLVLRKPV